MGWCKAFPPSFLETLSLLGHLAAPEGTPLLDLMLLASRAWGADSYLLHGRKQVSEEPRPMRCHPALPSFRCLPLSLGWTRASVAD